MIATQTRGMLVDAYRELNSKKLFWITMAISLLVVLACAAIGIGPKGVTILRWTIGDFDGMLNSDVLTPEMLYKSLFQGLGIKFWLTWLATVLALISTAGVIPDFIAGGSIELSLSKPIGRVRLFLTKFVMALLFVAMQVTVFTFASFLVLGFRGKTWEPSIFIAIPLVVIFFSYLYSICALLGLLTRSTIAALLLTLLMWVFLFSLNTADAALTQGKIMNQMNQERLTARIEDRSAKLAKETAEGNRANLEHAIEGLREELADVQRSGKTWTRWQGVMRGAKTFFPKTTETTDLLSRVLRTNMDIEPAENDASDQPIGFGKQPTPAQAREVARRLEAEMQSRSLWWVLGTSLVFEGLVLAIACWYFARKDF